MAINTTKDDEKDLTIQVVIGSPSKKEMLKAIENFYNREPTASLLWDLSRAEVSHVTTDHLKEFVRRAATLGIKRKSGRTAIFAPGDLQFGLGRMSQFFAAEYSATCELNIFRSRELALDWLLTEQSS